MLSATLDKTIKQLNGLVHLCKDAEAGFRICAEYMDSSELKTLLDSRSGEYAAATEELQALVLELGGIPAEHGSLAGGLHRRWIGLKTLIAGQDEKAVLNECLREERVAKQGYEQALQEDLPPQVRRAVSAQYAGVLHNLTQLEARCNNPA